MSYSDERKKHLGEWAKKNNLANLIGGEWQKNGYPHILKVEPSENYRKNKYDLVCKYNIIKGVNYENNNENKYPFVLDKMHPYAYHLNSSQVLCYNFFRPLLDNEYKGLIELLKKQGIQISRPVKVEFEYSDDTNEKTEFDFYVKADDTEIFFEIKYTEQSFGKWVGKAASKKNFENTYSSLVDKTTVLRKDLISYEDETKGEFNRYFQLFRNALRANNTNKYTVFIFPKANKTLVNQYDKFKDKYILDNKHIVAWYWEELLKENRNDIFYKKYFYEDS